jgi:hypothetical protein
VVNSLKTTSQNQSPILFVAVGGEGSQTDAWGEVFRQSVDIEFARRRDSALDPATFQLIVRESLKSVTDMRHLRDRNQDSVVSFLLSNQFRITAPLGKINELSESLLGMSDSQIADLIKASSSTSSSKDIGGSGSFGVFGVGGSASGHYISSDASADQRESRRAELKKNLSNVQRMVRGI